MTLEEAIKHCMDIAETQEMCSNGKKCAKEHRQLAGWLKELKALKEQQPCEDCISRQAAIDALESIGSLDTEADKKYARSVFEALSPVTPQSKTGRWIYTGDYITDGMLKCSECGFEHDVSERFSYCPNCGARMVESQESEVQDAK